MAVKVSSGEMTVPADVDFGAYNVLAETRRSFRQRRPRAGRLRAISAEEFARRTDLTVENITDLVKSGELRTVRARTAGPRSTCRLIDADELRNWLREWRDDRYAVGGDEEYAVARGLTGEDLWRRLRDNAWRWEGL